MSHSTLHLVVAIALATAAVSSAGNAVEPSGWYAGDPHVHRGILAARSNADSMVTPGELLKMMEVEQLSVISVLGDIGNGEVREAKEDLPLINGRDHPASQPGRILHWDAEWHFDPEGVTFEQKAIGGHLIILGLKHAQPIYRDYTHPVIQWAQAQGAVVGFAHAQYMKDDVKTDLDCCAPLEFPVELALSSAAGPRLFLMEDVRGSEPAMHMYYRLLNSGFRMGLAAGTDWPCYVGAPVPLGDLLTYVHIPDGKLTYRKWIDGIAAGNTVVSRNGHREFLDLKVNGATSPGGEVRLKKAGEVAVAIEWSVRDPLSGAIEIVRDGKVVAVQKAAARPGEPARWNARVEFQHSGWLCARRMGPEGHYSHTAAVFVAVGDEPVWASSEDAQYFVRHIDNLLAKTTPGGEWAVYFPSGREAARARYTAARAIYERIAAEARATGR